MFARYEMNDQQYETLKKLRSNKAWEQLGEELGFDFLTVKPPKPGEGKNIFYAKPKEQVVAKTATTEREVVEIMPLKQELLDTVYFKDWLNMEVIDDDSQRLCGDRMNLLYDQRDKLKADRDSVVKPLQLAIKRIDDMVNPLFIPIKGAYDILNKKLGAYSVEKRRKEEAKARQEQEIQAAKLKAEALIKATQARLDNDLRKLEKAKEEEQAAELVRTKPVEVKQKTELDSGVKFVPVNRYKYKIVDEAKIPREFLCVDEVKLQKYATAQKDKASVQGVEFFVETTMNRKA